MNFEDREYQDRDVDRAIDHGPDLRPIHCSPTGSGKTVIQARVAKRELARGNTTAILTPRNEIFDQTHSLMNEICGASNVTMLRARRRGEAWQPHKPIHVVSWPTLTSRAKKNDFFIPKVDRLLVDECHLSMAPVIGEVLDDYAAKGVCIDGYTATPARKSGKGLGAFFTNIWHVASVRQLIDEGYLAPCFYYGGATPDVTGIGVSGGDYKTKALSAVAAPLVGDVIDNWLRLASDRSTIVFAVDIAHAEALTQRFQEVGVRARALHTRLPDEKRAEVVADFKAGDVQVLVNVQIASYGFDAPAINCVVLARPTKSIVLHLQMMGRGMRPKTELYDDEYAKCMVLDHAGNVTRLGMVDDRFRWTLNAGRKATHLEERDPRTDEEVVSHECPECQTIFSRSKCCPRCGWEVPMPKRDIEATEADLVPIGKELAKPLPADWPTHEIFMGMLLHRQRERGYKIGWARYKFKEKAGIWPPDHWDNLALIPPSRRVSGWLHSKQIAWAKSKRRAANG